MVQVIFDIPDDIATELQDLAQSEGYSNAKQMVIDFLKERIKASRRNIALASINTDDVTIT